MANECATAYTWGAYTATAADFVLGGAGIVTSVRGVMQAGRLAETANAAGRAANTADGLLPGLPASAPKPLGLGSTGRTVSGDLTEQLAMTEVRSAPGGTVVNMRTPMGDTRWPAADGWVKMSQRVNGVDIHYVRNTVTQAVDDFKFANPFN